MLLYSSVLYFLPRNRAFIQNTTMKLLARDTGPAGGGKRDWLRAKQLADRKDAKIYFHKL